MADQIDRLIFQVSGQDRGGSKVLSDTAKHADAAHQSMSKLGSTLSGLGGPFEQVTNLASNLGNAFDGTVGKTAKLGLGLTAAGAALIAFGAKDQQAQKQLQQSIENTGQSYSDYRGQIEEAIRSQEKNAHTADDTQNALNTLTTATQDVTKSLGEMGLVADIAAAKHETLAEASTQLVQAQAGNTRAFKSFGIVLDGTGTKTDQINRALKELQDRLSGQASAAVDTTAGKFKVWGVELEDTIARLSKYGPLLTAAGVGLTAVSAATQLLIARRIADTAAAVRETAANAALAASYDAVAGSAAAAGAAQGGAAAGGAAGAARFGGYGALAVGAGISLLPVAGVGANSDLNSGQANTLAQTKREDPSKSVAALTSQYNIMAKAAQTGTAQDRAFSAAIANVAASALKAKGVTVAAVGATKDAKEATDKYATSLLQEKAAATKAADGIDAHLKALSASVKVGTDLAAAQDGLSTSMHNLAQSVHDGSTALKGNSTAAINNRAALRDVVNQELQVLDAMRAHHVSADKVSQAARSMSRAIEQNATDMGLNRRQVHLLLGDLNVLPGEIYNALAPAASLSEQVGESIINGIIAGIEVKTPEAMQAAKVAAGNISKSAQFTFGAGGEGSGPQTAPGPDPKTKKAAKDAGAQTAAQFVSGYAPAVDTGVSAATSKALDKAKQKLDREKQLMRSTLQQVQSEYDTVRNQIVSGFDVTNLPQKTDLFGTSYTAGRVNQAAHQFVRQLEEWAHLIGRLRKAGLNEVMVDQFEAAGVAAIPAMREVLRDHEVGSLNRSERHIQRISSRVAGAQVTATEGAHLDRVLARLPQRFADAMERKFAHMHVNVQVEDVNRHQGKKVRVH